MTAPMPETMKCPKCSYRSGDDWEQCNGSCPIPGSPHYTAALASSGDQLSGNPGQLKSGDHAELARLARKAREQMTCEATTDALCDGVDALLAENAALRAERDGMIEEVSRSQARLHAATEAGRKLAEADRLLDRAADLMRQCTDPDRFEGASTLNVYANMRAWLSDLPPAPGAEDE